MVVSSEQQAIVKDSLFQFITNNIPHADLNVIDDIVLSYVISILKETSDDTGFDLEGFIEMMSAYVPAFDNIDAGLVLTWILGLEESLHSPVSAHEEDSASSDKISTTLQSLSEMLPTISKPNSSRSNSESECDRASSLDVFDCEWAELARDLHEMFPNTCAMEIKHCISIAEGDLERAAATLLHRRENGQAISPAALHAIKHTTIDDNELKHRIIARYSYVDTNSDTKEHKPLAPKIEPKKMVRYRDNKIVSLKGERYTEVPKTGEDETLKKPKRQHCP